MFYWRGNNDSLLGEYFYVTGVAVDGVCLDDHLYVEIKH